jgi:hypothetical protein
MTNTNVIESVASGEEIITIVNKLENALVGVRRSHGIIAALSLALILENPEISPDALQSGVRDVSRYICLLLEGNDAGVIAPATVMN